MIPRRNQLLLLLGVMLFISPLIAIFAADAPLRPAQKYDLRWEGDRIAATYHPGSLPAGVLLLEGFGSDQRTLRAAASHFSRLGLHVMTFDFPGHGRSSGSLGFDNAATDRLARLTLAVADDFTQRAGLTSQQTAWLGHSLGARVALQAASLAAEPPAGLVLVGAQVNLVVNAQAEFFTGTSDASLAWVQALSPQNPSTNVLLLQGEWDDILTPASASRLMSALTGEPQPQTGVRYGDLTAGSSRQWLVYPSLVHNYEIFSARVFNDSSAWLADVWGLPQVRAAGAWSPRVLLWVISLAGLFLALWSALRIVPPVDEPSNLVRGLSIADAGGFLRGKLLLWLGALPFAGLVMGLAFLVPLGLPVFNLIYLGFIGGYGLLMLLLYRLGRVPGVRGKLSLAGHGSAAEPSGMLVALAANLVIFLAAFVYANSGWFFAPPLGQRLIWVFLLTPPTALGFWIGQIEDDLLAGAAHRRAFWRQLLALNGLLPFFLWSVVLAVLGSISGMIGALTGLLILSLVLLQGALTRRLTGLRWLSAVLQSLLLYALILPQGVLFKI